MLVEGHRLIYAHIHMPKTLRSEILGILDVLTTPCITATFLHEPTIPAKRTARYQSCSRTTLSSSHASTYSARRDLPSNFMDTEIGPIRFLF